MGQLAAMQTNDGAEAYAAAAAAAAAAGATPPLSSLFGGALSAIVPSRLADVSLAGPVPDHQEVFSDPDRDQALVIEILEHSNDVPDGEGAARFYFDDLLEQNEASEGAALDKVEALKNSSPVPLLRGLAASPAPPSSASASSSALDACSYAALAAGTASISKGRSSGSSSERGGNRVSLALALLRFPAVGSDLLISLTTATELSGSSSGAVVPADLGGRSPVEIATEAERLLLSVASSLKVNDWGLFG